MEPNLIMCGRQLGKVLAPMGRHLPKFLLFSFLCLASCAANKTESKQKFTAHSPSRVVLQHHTDQRPVPGDTLVVFPEMSHAIHQAASPAVKASTRIEIPEQPIISKYVRYYRGKGRITFEDALQRSWLHLSKMSEILQSYGVPPELVYVALVESRFKKKAISPGGAAGYWQLMKPTARWLGLRVDRWVDERLDPIKSTKAAAKYLHSLFDKYHSWPLALAAYNAGEGPVLRAIKRCRIKNYWVLRKKGVLPRITRAYVPKIYAAIKIARELEMHNFKAPRYLPVYDFDVAYVKSPLNLRQITDWTELSLNQLRTLNPALRSDRLPPKTGYTLRLPPGAKNKFLLAYQDYLNKKVLK